MYVCDIYRITVVCFGLGFVIICRNRRKLKLKKNQNETKDKMLLIRVEGELTIQREELISFVLHINSQ